MLQLELAIHEPTAAELATASRVLAALFEGGAVSAKITIGQPEDGQRRYVAHITARRAPDGSVVEEPRPRRLVIHPARTYGCAGGGPIADPQMPLPVLDRLWVLALRNHLDRLPSGTPGQRLPCEALAWLECHPDVLPSSGGTLTLAGIRALLAREGMMEPAPVESAAR